MNIVQYSNDNNCDDGFYGKYCNITYCNRKFSNHSKICSGNGYCTRTGVCNCDLYYYGTNCERRYVSCEVPTDQNTLNLGAPCNGRGLCNVNTNCNCMSANFTDRGGGKSVIGSSDLQNPVSGTIMKSADGSCILEVSGGNFVYRCGNVVPWFMAHGEPLYKATQLERTMYLKFVSPKGNTMNILSYPQSFSQKVLGTFYYAALNDGSLTIVDRGGTTLWHSNSSIPGKVETAYVGADCSNSDCYGYFRDEPIVCSGHGKCLGYNNCSCYSEYYGKDCSIFSCYNISSSNHSVCSGNGICEELDTCECYRGYYGQQCQFMYINDENNKRNECNGVSSEDPLVCSSNGICKNATCICNSTRYGNDCQLLKCNKKTVEDPTVCSSNGDCINGGCQCQAQYYGNECEFMECNGKTIEDPTVCSSNGSCIRGGCICKSTNYGNNCELIKCNGKLANETSVCSSNGQCIRGLCQCNISSYGNDCEFLKCNNKTVDDVNVCSSNGSCIDGTCDCNSRSYGDDCQYLKCNGKLMNNSLVCSSHGNCISGSCYCHGNYSGIDCENFSNASHVNNSSSEITCDGITKTDKNACSGNGDCITMNQCKCKEGYIGYQCQFTTCFGVNSNSSLVCSSNGNCVSPNQCVCREGYTGETCKVPICFGIPGNQSETCTNSSGQCLSPNKCECKSGFSGDRCEIPICFGKLASDSDVCSFGQGICVAANLCKCKSYPYVQITGNECQVINCISENNTLISSLDSRVCSNQRGHCGLDGCECKTGYYGEHCQLFDCYGILFNNSRVCNGNGYCTDYNSCNCHANLQDGFWSGSNCSECRADFQSIQTGCKNATCDAKVTCNNHGICDSNLQCICNERWDGKFCSTCKINFYGDECKNYCEVSTNCSSHGDCSVNGTCVCHSSNEKGFWKGLKCQECQQGYFGSQCLTQITGPVKFLDNYSGIKLKLTAPVSYNSLKVNCSKLISSIDLKLFGLNPNCLWINKSSNEFSVQFGTDYSLLSGMMIHLNRLVFDNQDFTDFEEMTVMNADHPITPTLVLSGQKSIGSCDNLILSASDSYSGDLKPLKFYWKIVSSPIYTLKLDLGNFSSIEIDYNFIPTEGEYKILAQVESSVSGIKSEESIWTITKSGIPLPTVSITGSKEVKIYKSESPLVIKKTIFIPSCFYPNQTMNIEWEQISGPTSTFEIDKFNSLAITSFNSLVESTYEYKITTSSIVNPLSTAFDTVKVTVKPSPLNLILFTDEISAESGSIISNLVDPDETSESVVWTWKCWDLSNDRSCPPSLDSTFLNAYNQKLSSIVIKSSDLESYSMNPKLKISLQVSKGQRSIESFIEFFLPEKNKVPPTVSLISVNPNRQYVLKSEILNLQLQITANGQSVGIEQYVEREWSLGDKVLLSGNSLLSFMTVSPSLSNSLVIDSSLLEEGSKYQICLQVKDIRNSLQASYCHNFEIALQPPKCPCYITPSSGVALETSFVYSCSNCQNSQKSLQIVYGFVDDRTGASIQLSSQGSSFTTKLPCSSVPLTNKIVTAYFKIIDTSTGAFTLVGKDLTIQVPDAKSAIEVKKKVSTWTNMQSSLQDGDPLKMVFNSATISRTSTAMIAVLASKTAKRYSFGDCQNGGVWNAERKVCDCPNGFSKFDCTMKTVDFNVIYEIRMDLFKDYLQSFESRNRYELITGSYLTTKAFGLDSLIEHYDEIDEYSHEKSIEILKQLLTLSNYNKDFRLPFGVDKMISSSISSIYNYLRYHQRESKEVVIELLKQFSQLCLRGMFVGERDKKINVIFANISFNKIFRPSFESRIISATTDSVISLPMEMPFYLTEKSNRKSISYISLLSNDIFGIDKFISIPAITVTDPRYGNNSTISNTITSVKYLRSEILSFELVESTLENIIHPIEYKLKIDSIQNYSINTLISSSNETKSNGDVLIRNIYRTSQISCAYFTNISSLETMKEACILQIQSPDIANCKCNSTFNVVVIENIIERQENIILEQYLPQPEPEPTFIKKNSEGERNLGIILGTVLGFSFIGLVVIVIVGGAAIIIRNMSKKEKKPKTPTFEMKQMSSV